MARKGRKLRPLVRELARRFPDLEDPGLAVATGTVLVDGIPNRNPASLVAPGASLSLQRTMTLRGEAKLRHALAACGWTLAATTRSPVLGARGAAEWLVHARR